MTTEQRELIGLAAKACGWLVHRHYDDGTAWVHKPGRNPLDHPLLWFKPMDPGDSRRLQVALGIGLERTRISGRQGYWWRATTKNEFGWLGDILDVAESDHPTPNAAACMAVLRVAGEIGRRLP